MHYWHPPVDEMYDKENSPKAKDKKQIELGWFNVDRESLDSLTDPIRYQDCGNLVGEPRNGEF